MTRVGRRAATLILLLFGLTARGAAVPANPFATSGVVEGFFGPVYSFEARRSLFRFTAQAGMNAWIYAPKDDPLHREEWREPYPPAHLAHFAELVQLGRGIGVRFIYAIAPGLSFDPSTDDQALLHAKLATLFAVGVRDFCVFFDDVFGAPFAIDPDVQVAITTGVHDFLRARDPTTTLCFISHFYEGTVAELQGIGRASASFIPGRAPRPPTRPTAGSRRTCPSSGPVRASSPIASRSRRRRGSETGSIDPSSSGTTIR